MCVHVSQLSGEYTVLLRVFFSFLELRTGIASSIHLSRNEGDLFPSTTTTTKQDLEYSLRRAAAVNSATLAPPRRSEGAARGPQPSQVEDYGPSGLRRCRQLACVWANPPELLRAEGDPGSRLWEKRPAWQWYAERTAVKHPLLHWLGRCSQICGEELKLLLRVKVLKLH